MHVRFVATLEAHYNFIGICLAETTVEVILALNRCLSFVSPNITHVLFGTSEAKTGYRTWLWMVPPMLWGLNYFVRETVAPFSSFAMIKTWNPHEGYANEMMSNVCCAFV